MGRDKPSLLLDGTPMVHLVRHALFDAGCGEVIVVGGAGDDEGTVADRWPGEGPLGGLATAVGQAADVEGVEIVVVAACDQPDLTARLLAELIHGLATAPPEVVASAPRTADGRVHPFPSAWRTGVGSALSALVDGGERRAGAALGIGPVVEVPAAPEALVDLDTPADLAAWRERRASQRTSLPGIGRDESYTRPSDRS
jgi:molybdopterin-guanine dinucleotide biosynthesis protein A